MVTGITAQTMRLARGRTLQPARLRAEAARIISGVLTLYALQVSLVCGATAQTKKETMINERVQLSAKCRTEEGALLVDYELSNHGQEPIVAFDGAVGDPAKKYEDLTQNLYIGVRGNEDVRILRVVPQPPAGLAAAHVPTPAVSLIEPGRTRKVSFKLPLPLKERSQFTPDYPGATYEKRQYQKVLLVIQIALKTEKTSLVPFPANPGAFRLNGEAGPGGRVESSCNVAVDVLVRTDSGFLRPE